MTAERFAGNLGEILIREGLITHDQLEEALRLQRETAKSLSRILVEMGVITESVRMSFLKKKLGYDLVSLTNHRADPFVLSQIPFGFALKHHVVPLKFDKDGLTVAMEDPSDLLLLDSVKNIVGMKVRPVIASSEDIGNILNQYPKEFMEAGIERIAVKPFWYRVLRSTMMPVLCFLPLVLFILLLYASDWVQGTITVMKLTAFDFFLYIILAWGIWTLVVFEINGLIFGKRIPKETSLREETKR